MKYVLVKIFWFFGRPIQKLYWFVFRPEVRGVKCLIENNGKFLLVKLNYAHHKWTLPGGGVDKKESFRDAAIREVQEETGIGATELVYVGLYKNNNEYKQNTVEIYLCKSGTMDTHIDPIEIEKAEWFERSNMPEDRAPSIDMIFKIYDEFRSKTN